MYRFEVTIHRHGDRAVVAKAPTDEASATALQHEARMLGRVRHPNIVELVAAPDQDDPSLITALAGSDDLAVRPPTDIAGARSALRSMAATLADLHAMGFAHGAVGAEHFVSGPGGRLTLCSFRRAREVSNADSAGCAADGRSLAGVIRWWLATIQSTRADRRIAAQLAEVADALESAEPPPLSRVVAMLDAPRRQAARTPAWRRPRRVAAAERPAPSAARPATVGARRELVTHALVFGFHVAAVAALALLRPSMPPGAKGAVFGLVWTAAAVASVFGGLSAAASLVLQVREVPLLRPFADRTTVPIVRRAAAALATFGVTATSVASFGGGSLPAKPSPVTATADPERDPAGTASTSAAPTTTSTSTTSTTSTSTTTTVLPPTVAALTSADAGSNGERDPLVVPEEVWAVELAEANASMDAPVPEVPAADSSEANASMDAPAGPRSGDEGVSSAWTVESGDHLWSIASRALGDRLDREPSADEVLPYWQRLIDANRDRLVDPSNPDLILAGQVFVLPEG